MPGRPVVSIVVPTRNKASRLRVTLACLAGQASVPELEVVVVDDGSSDETAAVAGAAASELPLTVVGGQARGRAAARNLGATHSVTDYLVFLDDDILVGPGFVAAHLAAAGEDRFVHGRLRELASAEHLLTELKDRPGDEVRAMRDAVLAGTAGRRHRLFGNALERAIEAMAEGGMPDVAPWLGCVGANVGMARRAWGAAGGFDEGFGTTWGCEDLELGLRLHLAGLCRRFAPAAGGIHLTHRRPDRWDQHDRNLERFRRLHPVPSVEQLGALLGPDGDPLRYVEAVRRAQRPAGDPVLDQPRPG